MFKSDLRLFSSRMKHSPPDRMKHQNITVEMSEKISVLSFYFQIDGSISHTHIPHIYRRNGAYYRWSTNKSWSISSKVKLQFKQQFSAFFKNTRKSSWKTEKIRKFILRFSGVSVFPEKKCFCLVQQFKNSENYWRGLHDFRLFNKKW